MKIGDIVYSLKGRDSGSYYAVVEAVDETRVKIADGDHRRIKNAKVKNVAHLRQTGSRLDRIAEKLEGGAAVFDNELFSALRPYNTKD
jgi:ribosomal protein L14E/L6E/L27E